MNLHFLLTLPHFHTCHMTQKKETSVQSVSSSVQCYLESIFSLTGDLDSLLTISCSLVIDQDLGDRSSDQTVSSIFLDGTDDVEGDLTGTAFRIVGSSFVVMNQEGVDQNTGVLWWHT